MNSIVALPIAAAVPVASPALVGNPDAAIIAAAEKLHDLKQAYDAAEAEFGKVRLELQSRKPQRPDQLRWRPGDGFNVGYTTERREDGGINCWLNPWRLEEQRHVPQVRWWPIDQNQDWDGGKMWDNENARPKAEFAHLFKSERDERNQARLKEALTALDEYTAQIDAIKAEIGFHEIEDRVNEIYSDQVEPLQKIIVDAEAQTTAGLRAKASVLLEWFFDDSDDEREPTQYEKLVSDVVVGIASQDWQQGRMV